MTPHVTVGTAARIVAMAFAVLAVAATVLHVKDGGQKPGALSVSSGADLHDDPLQAELKRCQLLGEAGAQDDRCLRAWAENRRRFLRLPAPPAPSPIETAAKPSPPNASPDGAPVDRPARKSE